jgi:hypothetical protein
MLLSLFHLGCPARMNPSIYNIDMFLIVRSRLFWRGLPIDLPFSCREQNETISNFSLIRVLPSLLCVLFFPLLRVAVSEMHFERERVVPVGI